MNNGLFNGRGYSICKSSDSSQTAYSLPVLVRGGV